MDPFHPLTQDEVLVSKNVLLREAKNRDLNPILFHNLALQEPPKDQMIRYLQGQAQKPKRTAMCVISVPLKHLCIEVIIDVGNEQITSFNFMDNKTPQMSITEYKKGIQVVKKDPTIKRMLQERGLTIDQVSPLMWPFPQPQAGYLIPKEIFNPRTIYRIALMYFRNFDLDNKYAHPLDFNAIVDVNGEKIVRIFDPYNNQKYQNLDIDKQSNGVQTGSDVDQQTILNKLINNEKSTKARQDAGVSNGHAQLTDTTGLIQQENQASSCNSDDNKINSNNRNGYNHDYEQDYNGQTGMEDKYKLYHQYKITNAQFKERPLDRGVINGNGVPKAAIQNSNFDPEFRDIQYRNDLMPLQVEQPKGPSFEVKDYEIEWQKWRLRIGFNNREGLVLYNVGYQDGEKLRPVLYRASIVELMVPYMDGHAPFNNKCVLDAGDIGLGRTANSLIANQDCIGHCHFFDFILNDDQGNPIVKKDAVTMYEEDTGILWKHVDTSNGFNKARSQQRRSRRLVLNFICTLANYEYAIYWYFQQDGVIGCDIKLTGILSTQYVQPYEDARDPRYGNLVHPLVNAAHHYHFFCARIDFSIDDPEGGKNLMVSEVEAVPFDFQSQLQQDSIQECDTDDKQGLQDLYHSNTIQHKVQGIYLNTNEKGQQLIQQQLQNLNHQKKSLNASKRAKQDNNMQPKNDALRADGKQEKEDVNKLFLQISSAQSQQAPSYDIYNAFIQREIPLYREKQAQRTANYLQNTYWQVSNPNVINPITRKPVAYKLSSPNCITMQVPKGHYMHKRGYFASKSLFVTPHKDSENFPVGDYTTMSDNEDGLYRWVAQDRNIGVGEDPVMWHTFGTLHFSRTEDFPVMPCETIGFQLKPNGFFQRNPGLDIPYGLDSKSQEAS